MANKDKYNIGEYIEQVAYFIYKFIVKPDTCNDTGVSS